MRRFIPLFAVLLALCATGCQRKGIEQLVGDELFSLSLGKLEDQIDLFQVDGTMYQHSNTICMRDGWFYLANGNAGKIMVFSSYGDLLSLLYNPKTNPSPVSLGPIPPGGDESVSTRGSVRYPFNDIGFVAVASDKTLYVEDTVPDARAVKDENRGMLLNRVIVRFDRKGKVTGVIGQEGLDGTPFPFITALYATARDQLVVVCRRPDSWQVFWFTREGALRYQVEIDDEHMPVAAQKRTIPSLVDIVPDMQDPFLYLQINIYKEAGEDSGKTPGSSDAVTSSVYKLNLKTRVYESSVDLPKNPKHKEKVGLKTIEIPSPPSDLLGVSSGGDYFLLAYMDANLYRLQILDSSGKLRAERYMVIEDSELSFRDLHISETGIVYGLLCDKTKARITLWRSDQLLGRD